MLPLELTIPALIAGVFFLYKGSGILIDGTIKTAMKLGISSLVISLTVVAYGTSTPELAISVGAAVQSHPDISLGNIVGSCIANILLILGLGAIIRTTPVDRTILTRDIPLMIGATLCLLLIPLFEVLSISHWIIGILFLVFFGLYIGFFLRSAQKQREGSTKTRSEKITKPLFFIVLGIMGVVLGAWLLIESSVAIARFLSIPEMIIALSMIAVGTSLPELVVSVMAAYKKKTDIALGNIIGSNVFNILLILGISALFIPLHATGSLIHIYFLIGITGLLVFFMYTRKKISRVEGILFLGIYTGYMVYIFFVP